MMCRRRSWYSRSEMAPRAYRMSSCGSRSDGAGGGGLTQLQTPCVATDPNSRRRNPAAGALKDPWSVLAVVPRDLRVYRSATTVVPHGDAEGRGTRRAVRVRDRRRPGRRSLVRRRTGRRHAIGRDARRRSRAARCRCNRSGEAGASSASIAGAFATSPARQRARATRASTTTSTPRPPRRIPSAETAGGFPIIW